MRGRIQAVITATILLMTLNLMTSAPGAVPRHHKDWVPSSGAYSADHHPKISPKGVFRVERA